VTIDLSEIRQQLRAYRPVLSDLPFEQTRVRAAVALLLRDGEAGTEILMIRRAPFDGDPWSGHIAFPGGRIDSPEEAPRSAAERETLEEVGVDLTAAEFLGRLDDLLGSSEAVLVSAFAYVVPTSVDIRPNYEVHSAHWIRLVDALDADRHIVRTFLHRGRELDLPAIRILDDDAPVLWGLTYRFFDVFMRVIGHPIPRMPWRDDL
jgi:8-oxo-dGTP pyrophosphatase MutT (NUDIX family)